jgi:type IV pilus biogenesis protein CpaD/CtpE
LVAGLAVATALVGGCSSKHEANDTLPSASETSASPSLEPLGPADLPMPADAREQTAAGAEAFFRYYLDLYDYSKRSLQSSDLRSISASCSTCNRLADQIDEDAKAGYVYQGGDASIDSFADPVIEGATAKLAFVLREAPLSLAKDGQPVQGLSFPERVSPASGALLSWDDGRMTWVINQLDVG